MRNLQRSKNSVISQCWKKRNLVANGHCQSILTHSVHSFHITLFSLEIVYTILSVKYFNSTLVGCGRMCVRLSVLLHVSTTMEESSQVLSVSQPPMGASL